LRQLPYLMIARPLPLLLLAALALAPSCSRFSDSEASEDQETDATSQEEGTSQTKTADGEGEDPQGKKKEPQLVRIAPLRVGPVERLLEATANVESLDVVDVMPERAEPVIAVLVEEGDIVRTGQVLARLRDSNAKLAVADAEVRVTETRFAMELAERELERDQQLVDNPGPTVIISDRDLETRRQTWEAAKTAFQTADVALQRSKLDLAQCELVAPIAGTISIRDISIGDMASVGTRVFQITDLSHPKVIMYRPQRELMDLKVGQRLVAKSEAMPGIEVPGVIERVAPTIDLETGTVKVTAALEPGDLRIPAGILVKLELVLDRHEDALLIPKKALFHEGDYVYCFVVRDDKAVRVEIFGGYETDEDIEAGEGTELFADDMVVVVGADRLGDGDEVAIAEETDADEFDDTDSADADDADATGEDAQETAAEND
jgi:membrane fusion protein (multidrug efflux system)